MFFLFLFVLKLVICRKNAVWSGVPAPAREVPGPWHFVEKMFTMFVRSKNVEGWSRCQDSRESAATKRGKIDVKTVYKIGKNMGWIILKRENPSVSRQCSTAFFFPARPRSCYSFFFMSSKLYCVEKMENWVWRGVPAPAREVLFFPLSWHLVQQIGFCKMNMFFSLCPQTCIL